MSELAQEALELLRDGTSPTAEQMQALELAIRLLRPAPLVEAGELTELKDGSAAVFPDWERFRESVQCFLPVVGRIDQAGLAGNGPIPVGTGFLIGPTQLVTNRHVIDKLTLGTGWLAPDQAHVRFGQEYGPTPEPVPIAVVEVQAAHEELDIAVLRIEEPPSKAFPIPVEDMQTAVGAQVAAVGYPMGNEGVIPAITIQFANRFGVKRASPGEVLSVSNSLLLHDCTTLHGNSGSPVLALDDARLVGVHSDGQFLVRNRALTGPSVAAFLSAVSEGKRR
jgi:S1-C subfamily serine protease